MDVCLGAEEEILHSVVRLADREVVQEVEGVSTAQTRTIVHCLPQGKKWGLAFAQAPRTPLDLTSIVPLMKAARVNGSKTYWARSTARLGRK